MVSTLEAICRRFGRLLFFLLVLPILSVALVYFLVPRTYQSSASVWALQRYVIIGATGPETDLASTPAQTQVTALTEILQSRAFDLAVAKETDLASTFSASVQANGQQLDDALAGEIAQKVLATPQGYNLYVITYTNHVPKVAQEVIQAVIQNFAIQSQDFTKTEAQDLLAIYQTQLAQAQQDEQKAASNETQYIQSHPNLSINDPQYILLHSDTLQAQINVTNIENTIATINQEVAQQGTGSQALFQVIDAPAVPILPQSRTKTFLTAGVGGLSVALLACVVYILIVVRRDRSIHTPLDLKKVTDFPVVLEMPGLALKSPLLYESQRAEAP